jgi:pimeloyl-ACP methyl ester carboxylesterase
MTVLIVAAVLAALALATQAGVFAVERAFPPQGRMIGVAGATLHVVDIGPRDAGPPIVLLHGASSNLEVMRQPLGERLSKTRRVILIDRPGHGWSTRDSYRDSTPGPQARMIDEGLQKLGVRNAIFVVHSWSGALGRGSRWITPTASRVS